MVKQHSKKKDIKQALNSKKSKKVEEPEMNEDSEEDDNDGGIFGSDNDDFYAPELDEFGLEADGDEESDDAPEAVNKSDAMQMFER